MKYKVSVIKSLLQVYSETNSDYHETEDVAPSLLLEAIQEWAEHRTEDQEMTDDSACVEQVE
tara:strand:+ start:631 stop:816 length:186 start_codon:yes stop_codon:yes gene_type:complete